MTDVKSDKERMAILELKKRMEGDMENEMYEDDNIFYKFLKARDFNLDNAEYMLRQHLEWRKKVNIKNISKYKPLEVCEKYFILTKLGYDKEGCLLKYNEFGSMDFRGIFDSSSFDEWNKFLLHFFEKDVTDLKKQSAKLGKTVDKVSYIINAENFSLSKATDKKVILYLSSSISMYLDNYPETLKVIYVINAPLYFNIFFAVLKPFLPNTVIQKIKIYSDDTWKKDLLEAIEADTLPVFLGGKRTDPDGNPLCQTIIKKPESVPKRYHKRETKRQFANLPDIKKINVPRASAQEVCFDVKEPGTHLEWEFQLKSGDIKFGIVYQDHKGQKSEVVPLWKLNTDECTENGLYTCENSGTYIAVFDNSHSHFRSKEIYYKMQTSYSLEELAVSTEEV